MAPTAGRAAPVLAGLLVAASMLLLVPAYSGAAPPALTTAPSVSHTPDAGASPSGLVGGREFNGSTGLPAGASNSVTGIGVDPATGLVYAANEYAGTVTVFDEGNGTVIAASTVAEFSEGSFPDGLALDTVGHRIFVSISAAYTALRPSGWLLVLNQSTLAVESNISFGSSPVLPFEPTYLAYDPVGDQVFVENQSWGYLAIVNLSHPAAPSYIACPVVSCAYHGYGLIDVPRYHTLVVPTCAQKIWFVNTSNDSTRATIAGPPTSLMAWAAYDSANDYLWVENYTFGGPSGSFFRMNLTTLAIQTNVPGAPPRGTDLVYDPVHNALIATNVNGSMEISTFNAANGSKIANYSTGSTFAHPFYTLALDPVTSTVIAAGLGEGTTVAFAVPTLAVRVVYPSFPTTQVAVGADPSTGVYFVAGNGPSTVRAVREATGAVLWAADLTNAAPNSSLVGLAVAPDRGEVFVADAGLDTVWEVSTAGGAPAPASVPGAGTICSILYVPSDGGAVFVGTTSPDQIVEMNASRLSSTQTLALPGVSPCSLAADPVDGEVLALSTSGAANVTRLQVAPLQVLGTFGGLSSNAVALGINTTGIGFALTAFGGTVDVFNASSGAAAGFFGLGGPEATSLAVDPVDGLLYLGLAQTGVVDVASTSSEALSGMLSIPTPAGAVGFDPGNQVLLAPLLRNGEVFTAELAAVPGAPTALAAVPGNNSLAISWAPPVTSGADPVDGYVVGAAPATSGTPGVRQNVTGTGAHLAGLADGVAYRIAVYSASLAGQGTVAATAWATPVGLPYPPTGLSVKALSTSAVLVQWSAPMQDDGSPVNGYVLSYVVEGGAAETLHVGKVTNTTITGLPTAITVLVSVAAINGVGVGNSSTTAQGSTNALGVGHGAPMTSNVYPLGEWLALVAAVAAVVVGGWFFVRRRGRKRVSAPPVPPSEPPTPTGPPPS